MLYPLKFDPIIKEKVWGGKKLNTYLKKQINTQNAGESWEISGIKNEESVARNGFLKGKSLSEIIYEYKDLVVGRKIFETFGTSFPLLIKFIDAADDLSVQVHPDDNFAKKTHNENGKNEIWYIVDAEENAELVLGLNKSLSKKEYLDFVESNRLNLILNHVKVKNGDVAFIPAGRIHAIMKGVLLAEIQQTSDLTYRIYDWDRKDLNGNYRPLHHDLAAQVVDLEMKTIFLTGYELNKNQSVNLVRNKFFTVNIIDSTENVNKDYSEYESFVILMNIHGNARIITKDNKITNFCTGETILIPASLKQLQIFPENKCKYLEIYLEPELI